MRRHFQVVDCTRHLGLPIVLSCIVLSLITGALNCFALYFLPVAWNYILMCYAGATALVGVLAALTGFRFFTVIYLLAESLCRIPVGVVIGYTSWVLANYYYECYDYIARIYVPCSWYTAYEMRLFGMDYGFLIVGDCVACLSFVLAFTTLAGFRKLRLHQAGVATAVETRGHHHHHVDAVVVEDRHHHHCHPQPAVITVAQPTVMMQQPTVVAVPAQNVIMQPAAPTLYPQLNNAQVYTAQVY